MAVLSHYLPQSVVNEAQRKLAETSSLYSYLIGVQSRFESRVSGVWPSVILKE